MKFFNCSILLFFLIFTSILQKEADAQTTSQYVYGHNDEEWSGVSIVEMTNENILILGFAKKNSVQKEQIVLLELSENCGIVDQKSFGGDDSDIPTDIISIADGGFIITGISTNSLGDSDIFLLRLDSNKDVVFFKTYGGSQQDSAFVVRAFNSGYIIGGKSNSWGAGESDAMLIHTDVSGDVIWSKVYGGDKNESCNDLVINSSNDILFCGTSESFSTGNSSFLFSKVDENGDLIFSKTYGMSENDICFNIATFNDKYVIAGQTNSIGNGLWDLMIAIINEDGSLEFARSYGDSHINSFCGLTVNSSIYLSSSRIVGPSEKLVLLKILPNGLLASTIEYGLSTFSTKTDYFANQPVLSTPYNMRLCGNTTQNGPSNKNIIFVKTALNGSTTCNSTSIVFGYDVANPTTLDAPYLTTDCVITANNNTISAINPEAYGWNICSDISSDFVAEPLNTCPGGAIEFTNLSSGPITSWNWEFEGGIPSSFSGENPPDIIYNQVGNYRVSLTVSDNVFFVPEVKTDYIIISNTIQVFTLSGGGSSCNGIPSSFSVSLSGSEIDVNYELFKNNIATGISHPGTGLELSFLNISDAGIYTVKAVQNSCNQWMDGEVVITIGTTPPPNKIKHH